MKHMTGMAMSAADNIRRPASGRAASVAALLKRTLPWAVAIAALLAILGWLGFMSLGQDTALRNQANEQLSAVKVADAQLETAFLQSKVGLIEDYDGLTGQFEDLQLKIKTLELTASKAGIPVIELDALKKQAEQKGELVNRFKAQHAIFRNSMNYLPDAVRALREAALAVRAPRAAELASSIGSYTIDYAINEDEEKADLMKQAAVELSNMDGLPDEVDDARREVVMHAYAIQRQKAVEIQLFQDLAAVPMRATLDSITTGLIKHFDHEESSRQIYRSGLIGFAVVLMGLLGLITLRLFKSFNQINLANATLESNVADRTQKLSQAMEQMQSQQSQLVQQEKMASLGQMVAGVAHEINTPLGYLRSGLQSAQSSVPMFEELTNAVAKMIKTMTREDATQEELEQDVSLTAGLTQTIMEEGIVTEIDELLKNGLFGVDQISEIVSNLKDFSRLDSKSAVSYNMGDCIANTLKIATNLVKTVTVEKSLESTPPLTGFPSQINQVLLNLITNAVHATEKRDKGAVRIGLHFDASRNVVRVDVADNGTGIPADVMKRMFDPFYTTKKVGQGTGLGLHISRQIIEAHKGTITVDSTVDVGTTFTLWLPVS
ncbi:MAG: ATP-binding protein [Fluviicoccus sp.]|uniref:DAHL domain-containing protein n=1 Tax=Fluviicoccus sp. TaxID=2003552 RepID=UPI002720B449|nr:DAHL domain-containing protein [Fluviicoccus sp.]MDO8330952.1 ATP-binding protein [Fluviicoccus sp.]